MEPTALEIELSKVKCFLAELDGRGYNKAWLQGTCPGVYNMNPTPAELNVYTATLCQRLRNTPKTKLAEYSLELQLWWQDHRAADERRRKQSVEAIQSRALAEVALAKLSPPEKEALRKGFGFKV